MLEHIGNDAAEDHVAENMKRFAIGMALWTVGLLTSSASAASAANSPSLCPHTANRMLFQDNAAYYDVQTKTWVKRSLLAATQLQEGVTTVGFVYLDDAGTAWLLLLPSADTRTRAYFRGLDPGGPVPLDAFAHPQFKPLPAWLRLEQCPAP